MKPFAAVDAEFRTLKRKSELAACLAGKDTRRLRIADTRAGVTTSTDGRGIGVRTIVVRMGDQMEKLRVDLTTLVRAGPRVA